MYRVLPWIPPSLAVSLAAWPWPWPRLALPWRTTIIPLFPLPPAFCARVPLPWRTGASAPFPASPPVPTENRLSPTKSDPSLAGLRMKISVSSIDPCPPFRPERPSNPGTKLGGRKHRTRKHRTRKHRTRKHRTRSLHRQAAPSRLVQDDGSR